MPDDSHFCIFLCCFKENVYLCTQKHSTNDGIQSKRSKLSRRITWRLILIIVFFNVFIIGAVGETEQSDDITMLAIRFK